MQLTIELPEDVVEGLESRWKDLPRAAQTHFCVELESLDFQ
jgi:hypothetical protein